MGQLASGRSFEGLIHTIIWCLNYSKDIFRKTFEERSNEMTWDWIKQLIFEAENEETIKTYSSIRNQENINPTKLVSMATLI